VLNSKNLTWTHLNFKGRADQTAEAGYTLLPDNTVLAVFGKAQSYKAATDTWTSLAKLPLVRMFSCL